MDRPKVLHAEDQEFFREVVKNYLSESGIDLTQVESGRRARSLLEQGLSPQLVITDLKMPFGDGYELIDYLNHSGHKGPVIVHSASQPDDRRLYYSGGELVVLSKDCLGVEMAKTVRRLLTQ